MDKRKTTSRLAVLLEYAAYRDFYDVVQSIFDSEGFSKEVLSQGHARLWYAWATFTSSMDEGDTGTGADLIRILIGLDDFPEAHKKIFQILAEDCNMQTILEPLDDLFTVEERQAHAAFIEEKMQELETHTSALNQLLSILKDQKKQPLKEALDNNKDVAALRQLCSRARFEYRFNEALRARKDLPAPALLNLLHSGIDMDAELQRLHPCSRFKHVGPKLNFSVDTLLDAFGMTQKQLLALEMTDQGLRNVSDRLMKLQAATDDELFAKFIQDLDGEIQAQEAAEEKASDDRLKAEMGIEEEPTQAGISMKLLGEGARVYMELVRRRQEGGEEKSEDEEAGEEDKAEKEEDKIEEQEVGVGEKVVSSTKAAATGRARSQDKEKGDLEEDEEEEDVSTIQVVTTRFSGSTRITRSQSQTVSQPEPNPEVQKTTEVHEASKRARPREGRVLRSSAPLPKKQKGGRVIRSGRGWAIEEEVPADSETEGKTDGEKESETRKDMPAHRKGQESAHESKGKKKREKREKPVTSFFKVALPAADRKIKANAAPDTPRSLEKVAAQNRLFHNAVHAYIAAEGIVVAEGKGRGLTARKKSEKEGVEKASEAQGEEDHEAEEAKGSSMKSVYRNALFAYAHRAKEDGTLPRTAHDVNFPPSQIDQDVATMLSDIDSDDLSDRPPADVYDFEPEDRLKKRLGRAAEMVAGVDDLPGSDSEVFDSDSDGEGQLEKVRVMRFPKNIDGAVAKKVVVGRPNARAVRKRLRWSPEEISVLRAGVSRYGVGKWSAILDNPLMGSRLKYRSSVDLKDKWRALKKQQ